MKRWLWIIAVAALVAVGIVMGLRPQPVPIEAVAVKTGPLRVSVEEEGRTRLRSRYIISAPVGGYIRRLDWKAGDVVKSGQRIAVLEPPRPAVLDARTEEQSEARVKAAESARAVAESRIAALEQQVRAARADLEYWRAQDQREEALRKSGDIAASRVEKTRSELRRAEAEVAAAERNVETARAEVGNARAEVEAARAALLRSAPSGQGQLVPVTAPSGGRVIRVIRESEGVVMPGDGLLEVGDARAIEVMVEVLSADAVKMTPGMRVVLERWGGEKPLEARVRVVEPGGFTKVSALGVEEQRVRVVADITSPEEEWQRLGDGYRVEASFVLWEGERVLQVPVNSLFRVNGGWAVFAVEGGVARRRAVQIGHRSGVAAEILSGLKEGDTVVAHPDETVEDGKAVAVDGAAGTGSGGH
ncbi:MAG: HlyD family efflux transporter periplasmic adaptor subunit [Bryobacterales bacterium]|nr:HlyD family efflux transporter periplasmic adaptor subunit [Bryobacterales bacterium]